MDSALVSVLIVTWNRRKDTLATLQSIYHQTYKNFEIILVDNASDDDTVEAVHQAYPAVRIIALEKNLGIAVARNAGIVAALGDIIFCLDNDASPANETIINIVKKFQAEPGIGIINSKIINAYTQKIDRVAGWAYAEKTKANQDNEFLSYNISEGGCAIRKQVLDRIGLFWDKLFFGCEGQELCLRAWDAGYKVLYYPRAIVYHRASPQTRIAGGERDYLFFKNTLYIYLVRYPWWMLIWFLPLKSGAFFLRSAKRGYLRQIPRAAIDIFSKLPLLLRQRRPIRNRTAFFYLKLMREHGPLAWNPISWLKYKI